MLPRAAISHRFEQSPIVRTQHAFVRVGMASAGSFGTILSIAILAHLPSWSDVWGRLWIHDGSDWGTPKEKGLSAAFCLFLLVGVVSDWFLKVKLGENPDEVSRLLRSDSVHTF